MCPRACYDAGMYRLLETSLYVIGRQFPTRAFVKNVRLFDAVLVYALTIVVTTIESFFEPSIPGENLPDPTLASTSAVVGSGLLALALIVLVSTWVVNRYTHEKFSLKDVFVLEVLLTAASSIMFSIIFIGSVLIAVPMLATSIIFLIFSVYMLLTFQAAISSIASITPSQAAYVILAPMAVMIIGWLIFLALIGGVASTM